jgi:hypothetical protein
MHNIVGFLRSQSINYLHIQQARRTKTNHIYGMSLPVKTAVFDGVSWCFPIFQMVQLDM